MVENLEAINEDEVTTTSQTYSAVERQRYEVKV